MPYETLFSLSNLLVMPFWLLMILLPTWRVTHRVISSLWIVLPPALLYTVLLLPQFGGAVGELLSPTLDSIRALLGSPAGATIGWVHFVALDLFVGRWAYLDSRARGLSPWLAGPLLFVMLMFAPLGLLLYLAVRAVRGRSMGEGIDQALPGPAA